MWNPLLKVFVDVIGSETNLFQLMFCGEVGGGMKSNDLAVWVSLENFWILPTFLGHYRDHQCFFSIHNDDI